MQDGRRSLAPRTKDTRSGQCRSRGLLPVRCLINQPSLSDKRRRPSGHLYSGLEAEPQWRARSLLAELFALTLISSAVSGARRGPIMFRMPNYDPLAIAVMGLGIVLTATLAFAF